MDTLMEIKDRLGITGDYQDKIIQGYISDVKAYMFSAGVKKEVIENEIALGAISRGVFDIWNYGSGSASFSPFFKERVVQLALEELPNNV